MNINCSDIFRIPIFFQKLNLDNERIKNFCLKQKNTNSGTSKSNFGGWQSEGFTEINEEFKELFFYIQDFSLIICEELKIDSIKEFNAWININEYMHFNWEHIHPKSTLSGVYYVKTPNDCGDISFIHPASDLISYSWENISEYNNYNSQKWDLPSEEGNLYIFPSWLLHKVYPNLNKTEERISISFNLW